MKVIELIRKLFAKAESAREIGSIEEAAAFAAKANELLMRHKLDMSEIELEDEADADPLGHDQEDLKVFNATGERWSRQLVGAVATGNFCRVVYNIRETLATRRSWWGSERTTRRTVYDQVTIVGRRSDREIATFMIQTLHREAKRLARKHAAEGGHRLSFLYGFVAAIHTRLAERRAAVTEAGGQYALVRLETADEQAEQALQELFPHMTTAPKRQVTVNGRSYSAGIAAGRSAGLGGIGGTGAKASRLLAS